jgi:positive regulator of sigma E activity
MPDFAHGQAVRLELPARSLTWLAVFHYLTVPVLTTLGALLASPGLERAGEGTVMAGGLAGFIVGCAVLRLYDSRAGRYWLSQLEVRRPD